MTLVSKADADYRRATVKGENCRVCRYMNDDGTCDRVEGIVEPDMTCDLFEAGMKRVSATDYTSLGLRGLRAVRVDPQLPDIDRQHYQRALETDKLLKLVTKRADKVEDHIGLLAERDDGSYWVIDGQHHTVAAIVLGIPTMDYWCFRSQGWEQEKDIYDRWQDRELREDGDMERQQGFTLLRSESERRFTLGVAWHADRPDESPAADGHRAVIRADQLERTAWEWMARSREVGLYHLDGTEGRGTVVESYIWRGPDWTLTDAYGSEQIVRAGDWLVGVIWSDQMTFDAIKRGEIDGYSPQGTARWRKAAS